MRSSPKIQRTLSAQGSPARVGRNARRIASIHSLRQIFCSPNSSGFLRANQPIIFAEILRQNETSSANKSSPRGSIQIPSTGRNDRTPPAQNRSPDGTLAHQRDGSSNQRAPFSRRSGNLARRTDRRRSKRNMSDFLFISQSMPIGRISETNRCQREISQPRLAAPACTGDFGLLLLTTGNHSPLKDKALHARQDQ